MLGYLNESGLSPEVLPLAPDGLAELIGLVQDGTLSRSLAKDVLDECLEEPKRPKQVVEERGLAQVSDAGELGRGASTRSSTPTRTQWPSSAAVTTRPRRRSAGSCSVRS